MIIIKHLDNKGKQHLFDSERLNGIYIFVLQRLDHILECNMPLSGNDHSREWLFERTKSTFICTIKDK